MPVFNLIGASKTWVGIAHPTVRTLSEGVQCDKISFVTARIAVKRMNP